MHRNERARLRTPGSLRGVHSDHRWIQVKVRIHGRVCVHTSVTTLGSKKSEFTQIKDRISSAQCARNGGVSFLHGGYRSPFDRRIFKSVSRAIMTRRFTHITRSQDNKLYGVGRTMVPSSSRVWTGKVTRRDTRSGLMLMSMGRRSRYKKTHKVRRSDSARQP